ncbi:MAG TPA: zinc-binding dehydrogenase [Ktedonobacteraceae bacterium]|nr:zinc-binding dehydrogenase [Ktedonobacteraceae bacterium]
MNTIRAVVVDPAVVERLVIREVKYPAALPTESLVRVKAFSLNRGDVHNALNAEAGERPGWDFAGVVEQQASDGSGPCIGARVAGLLSTGSWAEVIAASTDRLAELPESVSFAQAATLPVAGLTALWTLEHRGFLLDRRVLIVGASGGVGLFACQLAKQAGARVVGVVRQSDHVSVVEEIGVDNVVVSEDLEEARAFGPYNLILDSVGGRSLANAFEMLASGGLCINFGTSGAEQVTFDTRQFYFKGGATFYGFNIFYELEHKPVADDLARLLSMVADGRLRTSIGIEAPWTQVGEVAQLLLNRRMTGKAVLHVSSE